jgi:pilus assembly protein CpaF
MTAMPAHPPPTDAADLVAEVCRRVAERRGELPELIVDEIRRVAPLLTPAQQGALVAQAVARLSGLGELDTYLRDPDVDEVMVNAGRDIWIDRAGVLERAGTLSIDRVDHLIERVLAPIGRRVDRSSPIVDARLPDGARVCAVLPPIAVDGATLSVRRFAGDVRPLEAFTDAVGVSLCRRLVTERCNILVTGATSSGKTSLVASLIGAVPAGERLIVVEDTTELPVSASHAVRLEARPPLVDGPDPIALADLVRTALRLRPDRIVVGEVRGDEVIALVQAMNTGHDGSISTCHANGPLDALLRLESLVMQAAPTWPLVAIRQHLARSIDVIVHVERRRGQRRRRITSISEVAGADHALPGHDHAPSLRMLAATSVAGDDESLVVLDELTRSRR